MTTLQLTADETNSNLVSHAVRELDAIGCEEGDFTGRKEVLDLVKVFASQGHSGSSASWVIAVLTRLLRFEALGPLTDDPEEWHEVGEGLWQSRRQSDAFSKDGGKTYKHLGSEDVKSSAKKGGE